MQIGTRVFERIVREWKEAGQKAVADTMEETARFGCFSREYIEGCAKDRLLKTYQEIRNATR